MRLNSRRVVMLVFSVFVVVSVATLIPSTVNYLYFYRCIENLRLWFSDVDLAFDGNRVNLTCTLIISNVEPYSGLRIRCLNYRISFFDVDGRRIDLYGGTKWFDMVPLNPCSNFAVPTSEGPFQPVGGAGVLDALREAAADGSVRLQISGDALLFAFIGGFWISFEPWECQVFLGG